MTNSSSPKISVITVVRNGAATIQETILSVAAQDYPRHEHIVIDGASSDGTQDIVERHRHSVATFISERDRGIYDAMNKGLALATGDIIGFLNADDVYADTRVLRDIADALWPSEVDACYGDLVYVSRTDPNKVVRYWKSRSYRDGLFEKGWMPAHPTFYVKRWVYEKYGGFDSALSRQSDFELTMRFLAINHIKSVYIPRVLVRMLSGGVSRDLGHILAGNIEAYQACRKYSLDVTPLFFVKKILSRIPQFFCHRRLGAFP